MIGWVFAPEGPRRMALIRILLALAMLAEAVPRWRYAVELYSSWGPAIPIFAGNLPEPTSVAEQDAPARRPERLRGFHAPVPGPLLAVAIHTAMIFLLACVALGWQTRISLLLAAFCFVWIGLLDLPGTFAKHSVIALHALVLLSFSGCGNAWSIDSTCNASSPSACPLTPAWPRRLLQLLICSIYLGAALTKIRTPAFLSGDLLTFSLLDDQWGGGRFGQWLSMSPTVMRACSMMTILFEAFFPVLVWIPRLRLKILAGAFALHAVMGLALHLGTFSLIMFAILLVFLQEGDLSRAWVPGCGGSQEPGLVTAFRGRGLRGLSAWLVAAVVIVAAGVGVQWAFDWYGAFGRRDAAAIAGLKPIDPRQYMEMQAARRPAWEDYVHRVSLGNRTNNGEVYGPSERFKVGQRAYVLVQFILPHPELELEGLLLTPDGDEVARFSHQVAPGYSHSINGFELTDELPSGSYRIILQLEHEEFVQRTFELTR